MYRILMTLFVLLMICGTAIADAPFSNEYVGSTTSVDSEGGGNQTSGPQSPDVFTIDYAVMAVTSGSRSTAMTEEEVTENEATEEKSEKKAKSKRAVHRLPNYFGQIVTEEQKVEIYKIQDEYAPKVQEYREKLAGVLKERNAKIHAVLTPEQKEKLEQMKQEAIAKRKTKQAETATDNEEK